MAEEKKGLKAVYFGGRDAPTFYANQVNALVTQYDMRLRFSQIEEVEGENLVHKEVVTVYLAPAEVKALHRLLNKKAAEYDALWSKGFADKGADDPDQ